MRQRLLRISSLGSFFHRFCSAAFKIAFTFQQPSAASHCREPQLSPGRSIFLQAEIKGGWLTFAAVTGNNNLSGTLLDLKSACKFG